MNDNNPDPTKDMSPFGAALFNCFKSSDLNKQISELEKLGKEIEDVKEKTA